ncbi:MAG: GerAB/ArcD/ProY family transporter [Bacillota bacterium]
MSERQKISQRQAFYFLYSPSVILFTFQFATVINIAGRESWVAGSIGILFMMTFSLWTLWLSQFAPGHTILEILEMVAGQIIGRAVGIVYTLITVIIAALVLRNLSGMLQTITLPNTPVWVTILVILGTGAVIAHGGIEVQGRLAEVLVIVLFTIFFSGFLLGLRGQFNTDFIIPVFDRGIRDLVGGAYFTAGQIATGNLCLLVMVAALPRSGDSYPMIAKLYLSFLIIAFTGTLGTIGVFGAEEGARMAFADFNVTLLIQGLEVAIVVPYILGSILSVAAFTYCYWVETTRTFNNWRPAIWQTITVSLAAVTAISISSNNESYFLSTLVSSYLALPFTLLVLLLTSACLLLRGGKAAGKKT